MNLTLALAIAGGIVVFFWVFRSTPKQGRQILARWRVPQPTLEQGRLVADYLKARRNLYPYVLLAVLVAGGVAGLFVAFPSANWLGYLLATVLATLLITDLLASRRTRTERTRTASLAPRRVRDLVPPYGLAVLGAQLVVGVAALAASIAIQPWADEANAWRERHSAELQTTANVDVSPAVEPTNLAPTAASFLALLFAVVAALALLRLARDRGPLTPDPEVDAALRLRSARIGVASATFMVGGLLWTMLNQLVAWARPVNALRPDAETSIAADLPPVMANALLLYEVARWLLVIAPVAGFLTWGLLLNPWRTTSIRANA